MPILVNKDTRLIIQGITGRRGRIHTQQMIHYGTNVFGGVTPGKGGEWVEGKPVFDTVKAAINATGANASLIYVPASSALDAIYEAIDSGIELIVCITEGIPVKDMMYVKDYLKDKTTCFIGPNSPGILTPGEAKVGVFPGFIATPGHIGVVSRSGTLAYEVIDLLTQNGIGQSTCVGIGADSTIGMGFVDIIERFENDHNTEKIVLIGEIGGQAEIRAAHYIKAHTTKPIVALIAGHTAPWHKQMGHAGAIIQAENETAQAKVAALQAAGVRIAYNPEQIPNLLG